MRFTGLLLLITVLLTSTVYAQLVATLPTNLPTGPICPQSGSTNFEFTTTGDSRAYDGTFRVRVVKASAGTILTPSDIVDTGDLTGAYKSGSGTSFIRTARYTFKPEIVTGQYKLLIFSESTTTDRSTYSNVVNVLGLSKATISGGGTVLYGQPVSIILSFTENGPWSFRYNTNTNSPGTFASATASSSPYTINVPATASYTYGPSDIQSFSNVCGIGTVLGNAQITVNPLTVTIASVSSTSICPGRDPVTVSFSVNGTAPAGTTYAVQLSDQNGNFQNPVLIGSGSSSPIICGAQTMANLSPGTGYRVRVVPTTNTTLIQAGTITTPISLNRTPLPRVDEIGYCENAAQPLQAIGDNLMWYESKKNNVFYEAYNRVATPPSPTTAGVYEYQVTQTILGCQSALATLKVTVKQKSSPPSVTPKAICQNESVAAVSLANGRNLQWFSNTGTTIGSTLTLTSNTDGVQTYKVSQDDNGCRSEQATTTLTVNRTPPPPDVQNPAAICQFGPAQTLSARGQNLRWYDANGSALGGAPTPKLGSTATQIYQVSQTENNCEGPKARIEQSFKTAPIKPVVELKTYCVGQTAVPLTATATGQTLTWYRNGAKLNGPPTPPTGQPQTLTYEVSQTIDNCESEPSSLTVLILGPPGPPTIKPLGLCQGAAPASLTTAVEGVGIKWFANATITTSQPVPTPPTTQTGTQSYYVSQTVGNCEGPRAELKVTIFPTPPAPTVSPQVVCIGAPFFALSGNGLNLKWYEDAVSRANPQGQVVIQTTMPFTKTWFVSQTSANGCESAFSSQSVRVLGKATAQLTGDRDVLKFDSTAIRINLGGEGPWTVKLWDDRVITVRESPLVVWVRPLETRTYALKELSNDCGPGDPSNSYEIRVSPVTSVDPAKASLSLSTYPNPASGNIQIDWLAANRKPVVLRVLSVTGRIIWQVERMGTNTTQTELVNVGNWMAGYYFLQLQFESVGLIEQKIIKL